MIVQEMRPVGRPSDGWIPAANGARPPSLRIKEAPHYLNDLGDRAVFFRGYPWAVYGHGRGVAWAWARLERESTFTGGLPIASDIRISGSAPNARFAVDRTGLTLA